MCLMPPSMWWNSAQVKPNRINWPTIEPTKPENTAKAPGPLAIAIRNQAISSTPM